MGETILQYSILILTIVCLGYLFVVMESRGSKEADYYGLNQSSFSTLTSDECNKDNLEKILSIIWLSAKEVMDENKTIDEGELENKIINLSRIKILENGFNSNIDENSLRYMARLSMFYLKEFHK